MILKKESLLLDRLGKLLYGSGYISKHESLGGLTGLTIDPLSGDGSSRSFWRISDRDKVLCLAVAPPGSSEIDLAEARSSRKIGLHLYECGVPVAKQFGWDEETGLLLFEDFGDKKLHDLVLDAGVEKNTSIYRETIQARYMTVLDVLVNMQVTAAQGFEPDWCWDTPCYDEDLMLARESDYFVTAFWQNLLGQELADGLNEEFLAIAKEAAKATNRFFLHRDFQSRNIMITADGVGIIDYQGGRFGPLAYDLASLLIDPYVALPQQFQDELLESYLDLLEKKISVNRHEFYTQYSYLALQRNLQILGAFSFLSQVRGKKFFASYIAPSVKLLARRLEDNCLRDYKTLSSVTRGAGTIVNSL